MRDAWSPLPASRRPPRRHLFWRLLAAAVVGGAIAAALTLLTTGRLDLGLGHLSGSLPAYAASLVCDAAATFLIFWPIWTYRKNGQAKRIEQIRGFYSPELIAEYLARFWAGRDDHVPTIARFERDPADPDARQAVHRAFDRLLDEIFGDERISRAALSLLLIAALVLFFAFEGGIQLAREAAGVPAAERHYLLDIKPSLVALAAIFGAYTWVVSDVIAKYHENDVGSSDLNWYALRFVIAAPLGEAIAPFAPTGGAVLAFILGMFSLPRIQSVLAALANRAWNVPLATAEDRDDVPVKLPGIDQQTADRLAGESFGTIAAIATADPVLMSCRANMAFPLALEHIDQAILWNLVGAKLLTLREYGWAGASHVLAARERRAARVADAAKAVRDADAALEAARARKREANPALEAAQAEVLAGTPRLDPPRLAAAAAERDAGDATATVAQAEQACKEAASSLETVERDEDEFFKDLAEQAKLHPTALRAIEDDIRSNDYAAFIRRLMQVAATSSARRARAALGAEATVPLTPGAWPAA